MHIRVIQCFAISSTLHSVILISLHVPQSEAVGDPSLLHMPENYFGRAASVGEIPHDFVLFRGCVESYTRVERYMIIVYITICRLFDRSCSLSCIEYHSGNILTVAVVGVRALVAPFVDAAGVELSTAIS